MGHMSTKYRVQNPKTNEIEETFDFITDDELEQALATADAALKQWREKSFEERGEVLRKVASLFDAQRADLAKIIADEMGKAINEGDAEVDDVVEIFNYYADHGAEFGADEEIPNERGGTSVMRKVPLGVILGIMPWNFPYYQVARFAGPNLMLGNTILLKHAAMVPESAQVQEDLMREAGFPEGVYQNVFASNEQISEIVIPSPVIHGVSVTGSERAGKSVAATAGANLKKVVLELGGSDAFIVLDDKDIDRVAKEAVFARVSNNGQACTNSKRFIVVEEAYDAFVEAFARRVSEIELGDPQDEGFFLGPLVTTSHRDELAEQLTAFRD